MVSAEQNKKIYEFADFRLIPGEDLLLHKGEPIALNPKAFAVLTRLVERHGHLVLKSELTDLIWDDAFVEEGAISKSVWFLRNALGDTTKEKFIQTIPRRGYRFIAPVTVLNDPAEASLGTETVSTGYRLPILPEGDETGREFDFARERPDEKGRSGIVGLDRGKAETAHATGSAEITIVSTTLPTLFPSAVRPFFSRLRSFAAYGGIAVVLLGGVALYLTLSGKSNLGKSGPSRVAVLPFKPINAETRDAVYDLGIAEALISKLGADKNLSIRRLDAVRGYVDVNQDPIKAGKEQNVDYVLSANYQLANGRIKVTSQLLDVATGKVEDTFNVEKDAANLFAAQEAIANDIGNRLLVRFGSDTNEFPSKRGTNNEEAYRNYQQAMTLLDQQRPGSTEKAREYLDRAVELDPGYARAWAGKAYAYSVMWLPGRPSGTENLDDLHERSMVAAKRALAIDPNLSEAYTSLCENKFAYEFNYDEAEKDCKRAIERDPNSPPAYRLYSMLLTSRGRHDEAFAEIKTAMEFEPVSLRNQRVFANALYYARQYKEAIEVYKRLFDLNPDAPATLLYLIRSLERSGRESEALEILIKLLVLQKKDDATIERFKAAYASSGWRGVLNERIKTELGEKSPQYSVVAEFYGLLDDKDKAFEYLEKGSRKRGWMKMFLRVDPRFDPLRDDPRFADLIRRIESNG